MFSIARAMENICNDEPGCFGAQGGLGGKTLGLSALLEGVRHLNRLGRLCRLRLEGRSGSGVGRRAGIRLVQPHVDAECQGDQQRREDERLDRQRSVAAGGWGGNRRRGFHCKHSKQDKENLAMPMCLVDALAHLRPVMYSQNPGCGRGYPPQVREPA